MWREEKGDALSSFPPSGKAALFFYPTKDDDDLFSLRSAPSPIKDITLP